MKEMSEIRGGPGSSLQNLSSGTRNHLNFLNNDMMMADPSSFDHLIPLRLDFDQPNAIQEEDLEQVDLMSNNLSLADFPSLRDLQTSNLFSGINHNRLVNLDDLKKGIFE